MAMPTENMGKEKRQNIKLTASEMVILLAVFISRFCALAYFITGLLLRYHEDILNDGLLHAIDEVKLGELPLGSTVRYIVLSLLVYLPLITIFGLIGILGAVCRNKTLLIVNVVFSAIFFVIGILYVAILSWMLAELYYGLESSFIQHYKLFLERRNSTFHYGDNGTSTRDNAWMDMTSILGCCGSTGYYTTTLNYFDCKGKTGCYDIYREKLKEFGALYIGLISINIVSEVIGIVMSEVMYRRDVAPEEKGLLILGNLIKFLKKNWNKDKFIFLTSCMTVFFMVIHSVFWVVLMIMYVGFGKSEYMWGELYRTVREQMVMGTLADVIVIVTLVLVPLYFLLKGLYFLGIYLSNLILISISIVCNVVMVCIDIALIVFSSYFLRLLYCCYDDNPPKYICREFTREDICSETGALLRFAAFCMSFMVILLITHVVETISADRIYKRMKIKLQPDDEKVSGFFYTMITELWTLAKIDKLHTAIVSWNIFIIVLETCLWITIIVARYGPNHDHYLTDWFWDISKDNITIGRLRDGIVIALIAAVPVFVILKAVLFVGIAKKNKIVLIVYTAIEVGLLCCQVVTYVFFTYVIRAVYCCLDAGAYRCGFSPRTTYDQQCQIIWFRALRFTWIFSSFFLFHFIAKIIQIILSDRIYKKNMIKLNPEEESPAGLFYTTFTKLWTLMKVDKMKTATVCWNIFVIVMETCLWIAMIVERYGPDRDYALTDWFWNITKNDLNIGRVRDGIIIALIAAVPVYNIVKIVLFVGIKRSNKIIMIVYAALECAFLILELVMFAFIAIVLGSVYCCLDNDAPRCQFSPEHIYKTQCQVVWHRAVRFSWVLTGFFLFHMACKVVSLVTLDRLYKRISTLKEEPEPCGFFYKVWNKFWTFVKNNRFINEQSFPKATTLAAVFVVMGAFIMIIELMFFIGNSVVYFGDSFSSRRMVLKTHLHSLYKNNYVMDNMFDGLNITMTAVVPVTVVARVVSVIAAIRIWKRMMVVIFVFFILMFLGELVILIHYTYLMDLAYCCMDYERYGCSYSQNKTSFNKFCASSAGTLFDIIGTGTAFIVVHILCHVPVIVLIDRLWKAMDTSVDPDKNTDTKETGTGIITYVFRAVKTRWNEIIRYSNKTMKGFVGLQILLFILGFLFWIGAFLMCVSPGYLQTSISDNIYRIYKGSLQMGSAFEGLYIAILCGIPVLFTISVFGFLAILRRNNKLMIAGMVIHALILVGHLIVLVLSSLFLDLSICCSNGVSSCDFTEIHENAFNHFCSEIGGQEKTSFSVTVVFTLLSMIIHIISLVMLIKMRHDIQKIDVQDEDIIPMELQESEENVHLNDTTSTEIL